MKACRGNGVIAPRILNLGTKRSNTHDPRSQLDMSLIWPQARSGRLGAEKKSPAPAGIRNLDHPARSVVTILTELSRLQSFC